MTDKSQTAAPESDHAWVHDNLAAYLAGGLDPAERARLDDHINGCPDCFDAFTEGRDADRGVSRALSGLTPGEGFHERLMAGFRAKTIVRPGRLFIRRAGYAAAACVALAATGVLANYVMHQSRFNNPLTQMAVADADDASPQFSDALAPFRGKNTNAETTQTLAYDQDKSPSGKKMKFDFKNAQLDTVLNQMADTYGLIVVKTQNLSQQVTVQSPDTLDETQALALLNDTMYPFGYGVLASNVSDGRKVVRVMALGEIKKAQMPVFTSARPEDYPLTDNVITAVIPLKNVDAARLRSDLTPMISADADISANANSNNLIVTDTSAKINRIAQIVQSLDQKSQSDTIQEKMTLQSANAQDVARELNKKFNPQNIAPAGSGGGGGGGGAAAAPGGSSPGGDYVRTPRLYADYDTRTNTVVMVGPPDRVQEALQLAKDRDQAPPPAPSAQREIFRGNAEAGDSQSGKQVQGLIADAAKLADSSQFEQSAELLKQATTLDPQNASAQLSLRLVENRIIDRQYGALVRRMGTETMRHDIDNSEKLIPYADVMVYPDNWIDITRKRQTGNAPSVNDGIQSNANVSSGFINGGGQNFVSNFSQTTTTGGDPNMPQPKLDASRNSYNNSPSNDLAKTSETRTLKLVPSADEPVDQKALKDITAISNGGSAGNYDTVFNPVSPRLDSPKADDVGFEFGSNNLRVQNLGIKAGADFALAPGQYKTDLDGNAFTDYGEEKVAGGTGQTGKFSAGVGVRTGGVGKDGTSGTADDIRFESQKEVHVNDVEVGRTAQQQQEVDDQLKSPASTADLPGVHSITDLAMNKESPSQSLATSGDPNAVDAQRYRATYGWDVAYSRENFDGAQKETSTGGATIPIATTAPAGAGAGAGVGASTRPAPLADVEQIQRKIIKNGTVEFEVRSFQDTAETISGIVTEEAGFVSSSSSDKLANGKVRGQIVVRVPPDHLDRFLMKIRALGDLKSQQIGATDVTKEFVDIDSELRGLRTMEERLLDLIKNGKGEVKDLVEAEKQLGVYRVRIETLEGQERYYNNLVGMATLTITAYEKDIAKATAASEQELISVSVETEEVEAKYLSARKILDDAKAHIIESQLKNADADHFAATITADVPPEKADFVAAQLKQLGKVASFTRDRHQTTTNGTAIADTAGPQLQVEQKETRFSISMYNLANLSARETTVLTIAVPNVESTYRKVLSQVRQVPANPAPVPGGQEAAPEAEAPRAPGGIVASNLNGQVADQMVADITAEVRSDQADAVIQGIRDTGEVLASSLQVNQDNASTTAAKRRVQVHVVNIAAVNPKETVTMFIAVRDVDAAAAKVKSAIERQLDPNGPPIGKIWTQTTSNPQPDSQTVDFRAEVKSDQAESVLQSIRDTGELMTSVTTQNSDPVNATASKRGLQIRLINVAAVSARESQSIRLVSADVADSYNKLLASLNAIADKGNGRVITSQLNQSDARSITASLRFEVRRDQLSAVDKAFTDAGVDFLSRQIVHAANVAGTLDSKVAFSIDELKSAESLEPRRTFTLNREVDNVEASIDRLRSAIAGTAAREVDFSRQEVNKRLTGHLVLTVPSAMSAAVQTAVRDLGGIERDNFVSQNPQVPDTRFAKDRIEVNLIGKEPVKPLVPDDKGIAPTVHAALASSAGALLWSMYLVLTGLLFILPFALISWPIWKLSKRRRAAQ